MIWNLYLQRLWVKALYHVHQCYSYHWYCINYYSFSCLYCVCVTDVLTSTSLLLKLFSVRHPLRIRFALLNNFCVKVSQRILSWIFLAGADYQVVRILCKLKGSEINYDVLFQKAQHANICCELVWKSVGSVPITLLQIFTALLGPSPVPIITELPTKGRLLMDQKDGLKTLVHNMLCF